MAYSPTQSGWNVDMSQWEQTGDGAVYTTVQDLRLWDNNFYEPKVGGAALLEELHRTGTLADGSTLRYAAGLVVDQYRGLRSVSHGGAWGGYRAELLRFPEQKLSVAALCNVANSGPSMLARSVASIYLADRLAPVAAAGSPGSPASQDSARAARPVMTLSDAELRQWAGTYASMDNGSPRVLAVDGGRLMATVNQNRVELVPHSATEFTTTLGDNTILLRFERGPDGRRIRQWIGGQEGRSFEEVTATAPPAAFAGMYWSEELAASFSVADAGDMMRVTMPSGRSVAFRQIRDGFFVGGGMTLRFDAPRDGRGGGFALDQGRVRGIRFVRKQD
jgi:hypothetical protein